MPVRRPLAVLAAVCGLLGLHSLPASAAKGADDAASTVTSAGESTAQATRRAERAAAKAEVVPAPPPSAPASAPLESSTAPPPPPAHGHHAQAGPPPPPAFAGQGAAGQGTVPGSHKAEHAQRREERRTASTPTSSTSSGAGSSSAAALRGGETGSEQSESLARKQKKEKGSGGGQKGKKERKEKGKKSGNPPPQEEPIAEQEGAGSEGSSGAKLKSKGSSQAGGSVEANSATASLALPALVPAGGTGDASISSALPAAKGGLSGAALTSRAKHRSTRHHHKAAGAALAAGAVADAITLPSAALSSGSGAPDTSGPARARAKHKQSGSTQPAIVKTFTKIVGVVPTPVWILIGALIVLALLLGARSLLSGVRARRLERQRGQLLEDVGLLQAALLPDPPARLGPVATSAAYRPADGPGAGGDFYDVFALEDGEIAVVLGDVSGHGREALPHTALLRFTVRAYLEAGLSPRKALQTAGSVLERQLAGSFATVVAATYNPRERKLTYASAGHPPPIVLGDGEQQAVAAVTSCSAPPIGTGIRTGTRQTVVSVPGPARFCFHTDGVTEARIDGDLFGAGRLADELVELPSEADAGELLHRVAERSDSRPDDMAACLLRIHDGHGAPAIALDQIELDRELAAGSRVERFLFDWGVPAAQTRKLVREARERLGHVDTLLLELTPSEDGSANARLVEDNVIRPAALAGAGVRGTIAAR
ncbi:MAG TPA: PP2C family protein-serine/threonine phosphatase [Solirubrobacteraceae bacterium]|nr:PP2C family protein-serine/threonine phosphatase [Solirubrobacteraceae bacterium]